MRALDLRRIALGVLFAVIFQPVASGQSTSFDEQKMDTYLNKLVEEDKFMGSVDIDSAGQDVYNNSLGYMSVSTDRRADEMTKYRIGSVTKTFTATMILQLVEEEKLSLSAKLSEFYPEIPKADSITVEHMLRHQSGLYNFTNSSDYPNWMTEDRSKEQMLELFRGLEPQFSPGQQVSYSNTNYVLLGYIIEDITGESYANQLQKRIAEPLNLENTYYGDGIDPSKGEAESYRFVQSSWSVQPETDMDIPGGAGAIVSTPDDLTDFIRGLFQGKLISKSSLDKMTTIEQRLGMGLMRIPFYDTYAFGHNGGIDGFQSNVSYFPDEDIAFAFTSNALNYTMNEILIGALSIYFGRDFEIPSFDQKTITLSEKQMQKYVGSYESEQLPMDIKVFIDGRTLKAQGSGQSPFPLTASSETTMRFNPAGVVMEFDSLSADKYQQFMLKQSGGKYLFKRKK